MPEDHIRLARLFQGQTSVWGAVHGEQIKRDLEPSDWADHVRGDGSVGVYPLVEVDGVWSVRWGCVDIDDGYEASLPIARNLHNAYGVLGLTSWIERTKGKGYHTWLLASDWVPSKVMRNVQLLACALIDYTPREVNPKQEIPPTGVGGSYVNVPYAKKWKTLGHVPTRVVLNPAHGFSSGHLDLVHFLVSAECNLNTPEKLGGVAKMYRPPPILRPTYDQPFNPNPNFKPYLSPLTYKVLEEGPLPSLETGHIDRSAGLQKLAHLCAKDGLQPSETYAVVAEADVRWGKFAGRSDAELRLREIVERAYG